MMNPPRLLNPGLIHPGLACACLLLGGCLSFEPATLVPAITLSPEQVSLRSPGAAGQGLDFGLDVTVNESDSLFNVETLPGVRVRTITPGGPAAAAGIATGDVILAIDGMDVNQPDAVLALAEQNAQASEFEFTVRRGTTVFAATLLPRRVSAGTPPRELYRVDPVATRAGYRTRLVEVAGQDTIAAAEIVTIFNDSPLPAAGLAVGEVILSLNGRDLSSAQDLVSRLNQEHALGETVTLGVFDGAAVRAARVELWDPGRRLARLAVLPLLRYESALNPPSRQFTLLDLWLFSLYNYRQVDGERSHSILGLINITSDYGELIEEP
ncbi:MAG: PDZ domain-containing protein [Pseudohongiellaceae bacterium]